MTDDEKLKIAREGAARDVSSDGDFLAGRF
jgi:hypothetical protein